MLNKQLHPLVRSEVRIGDRCDVLGLCDESVCHHVANKSGDTDPVFNR